MPRGWGIARRSSAPPGLQGHRVGVGARLLQNPSPATVSEVARAGPDATWRRHLAAVPRRGFISGEEGKVQLRPWDWRARDLGSREDVGIRTKMLRGVLEPMDSSTEKKQRVDEQI